MGFRSPGRTSEPWLSIVHERLPGLAEEFGQLLGLRETKMSNRNTHSIAAATVGEAEARAKLIDIAGEGIPSWLWNQSVTAEQSPLDVGTERARRETGGFCYKNAVVLRAGHDVAGMMLGYPIERAPEDDPDDLPAPVAPFVALEKHSVGSWYINALAVFPEYRGKGMGSLLLRQAENRAKQTSFRELSIQVYAQNFGAVRLYERHGFKTVLDEPVREHPCQPYYTGDVLLLKKRIT